MVANKKILDFYTDKDISFSNIISKLVSRGQVAGYTVLDAYYSISDMDRLELMREYLKAKKILLIDRDGVINQKAPRSEYITSWEQFSFIPEDVEGMKNLVKPIFVLS